MIETGNITGNEHILVHNVKLCDCNGTRTHNNLVRKRTLNYLASFAKWSSVHLRTKRLWIRVPMQSLKLHISRLFRATKTFLDIQATTECRFTLKCVRDIIKAYSQLKFCALNCWKKKKKTLLLTSKLINLSFRNTFNLVMLPSLPRASLSKFRQVWTWLRMSGHNQPKVSLRCYFS